MKKLILMFLVFGLSHFLGACSDKSTSQGSFTIELSRDSLGIAQNSNASLSVLFTPKDGFKDTVTLSVEGLPAGITSETIIFTNTSSEILPFQANAAPLQTEVEVTVVAVSGQLRASKTFLLSIVEAFTFSIDSTLEPSTTRLPNPDGSTSPVAASMDSEGILSSFIANELIFRPSNKAELDAFLTRYNATIIADNAIPDPPTQTGIRLTANEKEATAYVVRLDPTIPLTDFAINAEHLSIGGSNRFSSESMAHLTAILVKELNEGLTLELNHVYSGFQSVLTETEERELVKTKGSYVNAFDTVQFKATGSKANVTGAWQFMAGFGTERRVDIAIIDGGFWLDPNSFAPLLISSVGTDLPPFIKQYDFFEDNGSAAGENPNKCTAKTDCPWHGNDTAGIALGLVNNRGAAAGTGGQIADPILFRVKTTKDQVNEAIRVAAAWGAEVINMSFGGPCNQHCRTSDDYSEEIIQFALDNKVILVAASGNDAIDVNSNNYVHPCILNGVICVGALDSTSNKETRSIYYSNYGESVDIWAPTDIPTMPNGASGGGLSRGGGTSASAPFVAGVAAMMKSINPALNSEQVRDILRETAWRDSPDPKVTHYLNAYEAVQKAANYTIKQDRFEPNEDQANARSLNLGDTANLSLHDAADIDFYRFNLASPSDVTIDIRFPEDIAPSNPAIDLRRETASCGIVYLEATKLGKNEQRFTLARAPATDYLLPLIGGGPLPYELNISSVPIFGGRLDQDELESHSGIPNNTFADRTTIYGGFSQANFHTSSDIDYYGVFSDGSGEQAGVTYETRISLNRSDIPTTVSLYSKTGILLAEASNGPKCKELVSFVLEKGEYVVRFSSDQSLVGSYLFEVSTRYDFSGINIPELKPRDLKPFEPIEHYLIDPEDWYVFQVNTPEVRFNELTLWDTEQLHMTLIDTQGNIIAEAVEQFEGYVKTSEVMDISSLEPDTPHLLKVERQGPIDPKLTAEFPVISFKLAFTE